MAGSSRPSKVPSGPLPNLELCLSCDASQWARSQAQVSGRQKGWKFTGGALGASTEEHYCDVHKGNSSVLSDVSSRIDEIYGLTSIGVTADSVASRESLVDAFLRGTLTAHPSADFMNARLKTQDVTLPTSREHLTGLWKELRETYAMPLRCDIACFSEDEVTGSQESRYDPVGMSMSPGGTISWLEIRP